MIIPAIPDVDRLELDAEPLADGQERRQGPGMLELGGQESIAGLPVNRPCRDVHRVRRRMRERDRLGVGGDDGGDGSTRLVHSPEGVGQVGHAAAPGPQFPVGQLGHRRRRLAGQGSDGARVEVDPGAGCGKGLPDRRHLLGIRQKRGDHVRMIPAMPPISPRARCL